MGLYLARMTDQGNEFKHWKGVSDLHALLAHDDPFVMTLRIHIMVERVFNEMLLIGREGRVEHFERARLTWSQKLGIVRTLGMVNDDDAAPLQKLNGIRNDLAHGHKESVTPKHEHEFWTAVPKFLRDGMLKGWEKRKGKAYDEDAPHAKFRFGLMLVWLSLDGDLESARKKNKQRALMDKLRWTRAMRDHSLFPPGSVEAMEEEVIAELRELGVKGRL